MHIAKREIGNSKDWRESNWQMIVTIREGKAGAVKKLSCSKNLAWKSPR